MISLILTFSLIVIVSYFIGNISFARLLTRKKENDITKLGSGNPGTMNMTRNFGVKLGLITLILDMLKAIIPCVISYIIAVKLFPELSSNLFVYTAGFSVVIGHMFPVCYKFKGGKGIACTLGIFAVSLPIYYILAFLVLGIIILLLFKIGSLTSLTLVTGLSVVGIIFSGHFVEIILISVIYLLLIFAHRTNIVKLFTGKENKVNLFKKKEKKEENVDN